jgi:hypothetical protein
VDQSTIIVEFLKLFIFEIMERNPYIILGLNSVSSKAEITKAMATAMKNKLYPVNEIAKAQKTLMKPEERLVADFLSPIHSPSQRFQRSDFSGLEELDTHFEMLPACDLLERTIHNFKAVSKQDLELGKKVADSFTFGED